MGSSKTEGGRFAGLGTFESKFVAIKRALVLLLAIGLIFWFGQGGCGGGGSGGDGSPSCEGPVPCLTENWGTTYHVFKTPSGPPEGDVIVAADGTDAGIGTIAFWLGDYDPCVLVGQVESCYDADLYYGEFDFSEPWDFVPDYSTYNVVGHLNICGTTLSIRGLIVDGIVFADTTATYVGLGTLSVDIMSQMEEELPAMLMHELMKRLSIE